MTMRIGVLFSGLIRRQLIHDKTLPFPEGIAIGEVSMVLKGEYGMFQIVEVRPAVNISRLEEVLVLLHQSE